MSRADFTFNDASVMNHITLRTIGLVSLLFVCIGLLAGCSHLDMRPVVDVAPTASVRPQPVVVPATSTAAQSNARRAHGTARSMVQ